MKSFRTRALKVRIEKTKDVTKGALHSLEVKCIFAPKMNGVGRCTAYAPLCVFVLYSTKKLQATET